MSGVADAPVWLWAVCALAAAAVQTARNVMQRQLTERLGTVGATHVRFLFGLPFALVFLGSRAALLLVRARGDAWLVTGALAVPRPSRPQV